MTSGRQIAQIFQQVSPKRRKQLIFLTILMVGVALLEVLTVGSVMPFLAVLGEPEKALAQAQAYKITQHLNIQSTNQMTVFATLGFMAISILSGVSRVALLVTQTKLSYAIGADLSWSTYRSFLTMPYSVYKSHTSSDIIATITAKVHGIVNTAILPALQIITALTMLTFVVSALLILNPLIALIGLGFVGLLYAPIVYVARKKVSEFSKVMSYGTPAVVKTVQEGTANIKDIILRQSQTTFLQEFRTIDLELRRAQAGSQLLSYVPRYLVETVGMLLIALVAYILTVRAESFYEILPTLGAIALGGQRMMPIVQQAYSNYSLIKSSEASINDVLQVLERPQIKLHETRDGGPDFQFNERVRFDSVVFSYEEDTPSVLQNFDLEITKGEKIGIYGKTGKGKSTFVDLLLALLKPKSGAIYVDDTEVTARNAKKWQDHISHVPQSIFIADQSILWNVAFGEQADKIDQTKVIEALEQACILDFVNSLPDGVETTLGELGNKISGGQRQRIGIARALYQGRDIIVLDEATNALDEETEKKVLQSLCNGLPWKVTLILISHRLENFRFFDRVFEFGDLGPIEKTDELRR